MSNQPDFQGPLQIEIESVQGPSGPFCEIKIEGVATLRLQPSDMTQLAQRFAYAARIAEAGGEGFVLTVPPEDATNET